MYCITFLDHPCSGNVYVLCGCVQQKSEFIKRRQNAEHHDSGEADENAISAEELSQFYKQFLDNNYEMHRNYNRFATHRDNGIDNKTMFPMMIACCACFGICCSFSIY